LAEVVLSHLGQKEYQNGNPNFDSSNRIPNHRSRAGPYDHALAEGLAVMAALIATAQAENSHYYTRLGQPVHGTLREARKVNALPSVTNGMSILAKPGLIFYLQETAILSAISLPKEENEIESDFVKRVVLDTRKEVEAAAERGTYTHSLCEILAEGGDRPADLRKGFEPHWKSLKSWFSKVHKIHLSEQVLVNEKVGYAGRVDLIAEIVATDGPRVEVIDFKTRKFKKDKKGNSKADSYSTDLYQLAAYCFAHFDEPTWCRNVYIEPVTGQISEKEWSPEEVEAAFEVFKAICVIWQAEKKYNPTVEAK
jgi:hypothetical protein